MKKSQNLLLIGPGKHFGKEILLEFAKNNFQISTITQSKETSHRLKEDLTQYGYDLLSKEVDISDFESFRKAIQDLGRVMGTISCLIYSPKVNIKNTGFEIDPEDFQSSLGVNVTGSIVAVQSALPYMQDTKNPCVIFTGGGFKDTPDPDRFALSVGKAALHGVVQALQEPARKKGLAVKTIVIDGYVRADGPIFPSELATFYWNVYSSQKEEFEYFYPPKSYG